MVYDGFWRVARRERVAGPCRLHASIDIRGSLTTKLTVNGEVVDKRESRNAIENFEFDLADYAHFDACLWVLGTTGTFSGAVFHADRDTLTVMDASRRDR